MPTSWFYPSVATQFCEADVHVPWMHTNTSFTTIDLGTEEYEINCIRSAYDLRHISNPLVNDMKMRTYYLVLTGFNWEDLPPTITGIEAYVGIRRTGRITDETVRLYNGQAIGDNRATADLSNIKTYGSPTDRWDVADLTPGSFDENFGLILRYQSHPNWPHQSTPQMDHVQIRVW
jgi:hypothetical protein